MYSNFNNEYFGINVEGRGYGNNRAHVNRFKRPGKQEIINWFKNYMGASEMDLVDESFDSVARHVCLGGVAVELLPKQVYNLQFPDGVIMLEYYRCNKCGKVILNRNFM